MFRRFLVLVVLSFAVGTALAGCTKLCETCGSPVAPTTNTPTPPTTYTLVVNNGQGGGNYAAGASVNIAANGPPSGQVFDRWTGDTNNVANVGASSTTLTMPSGNATITATYKTVVVPPACGFAVSPTLSFGTGGGNGGISVGASRPDCSWSVSGVPSWLSFSPVSGAGTTTITVSAPPNSGAARSVTITIAGVPVVVSQAGT